MGKNATNLNELFGRKPVLTSLADDAWPMPAELIGVEIEAENINGDWNAVGPEWANVEDASLRNGREFVLAAPLGGKRLTKAIDKFFGAGLRYSINERTSTHIHINASDNLTVDQFRNMFVLMYVIEPAIFRWADENRKWCGYCCPLTDIDPDRLGNLLSDFGNQYFVKAVKGTVHHDRYYGFNMAAYAKHGTVEFRYFPCTANQQDLVNWIKFVMYVKKISMEAPDPETLLRTLSTRRLLEEFIAVNFAELANTLVPLLDFDDSVARVHELLNLLVVKKEQANKAVSYKTQRSKGFLKLLESSFPKHAQAASEGGVDGLPKEAWGAYKQLAGRGRAGAAPSAPVDAWLQDMYDRLQADDQQREPQQREIANIRAQIDTYRRAQRGHREGGAIHTQFQETIDRLTLRLNALEVQHRAPAPAAADPAAPRPARNGNRRQRRAGLQPPVVEHRPFDEPEDDPDFA